MFTIQTKVNHTGYRHFTYWLGWYETWAYEAMTPAAFLVDWCSCKLVSVNRHGVWNTLCRAGADSLCTAWDNVRAPHAPLLYGFLGLPGCALAHCARVWWSASCFMVVRTRCTRHSHLFAMQKLWNEKHCKKAKK